MNNNYIIISILIIGVVTFILRAIPFAVGNKLNNYPFIMYISDRLPLVLMFTLTVYASGVPKAATVDEIMPQLLALVATVIIHITMKNYLLSILIGVISYMYLSTSFT
ncbi:MAG: AzlD domain-containing protein [Moritella sp.]|uniref:branched-chain amino acid transporter permease n=1 Tax=Moritella sp. TaxID=78556 RepID=UPI001DF09782|nr:AzlD domain-containing protein [Moritella sp.]